MQPLTPHRYEKLFSIESILFRKGIQDYSAGKQTASSMLVKIRRSAHLRFVFALLLALDQVQYACLDAYASVLLYLEIGKFKDPISNPPPSNVDSETEVSWKSNPCPKVK